MSAEKVSTTVVAVSAILALQAAALWVISVWLIVDTIALPLQSLAGAVFLDLMVLLSGAACTYATIAFWRGVGSSRSAVIVWQVILLGIGIASAQGVEARWDVALALTVPAAIVTTFMLFSREVSRHLGKDA